MEESDVILVLRIFVDLKRIIQKNVLLLFFFCKSIVRWRRMAKFIYVNKPRFIKAILF